MFYFKQSKPGYILIYTIVLLGLISFATLATFQVELMRKRYTDLSIETYIEENRFDEGRAQLLSMVNNLLKESFQDKSLNEIEVHNTLLKIESLKFNNSFLEYNKNTRKLKLELFNDRGLKKVEYYGYYISLEENRIKFFITKV